MFRLIKLYFSFSFRRKWLILVTFFLSLYSYLLFKFRPKWIRFGRINHEELNELPVDPELVKDIRVSIQIVTNKMPVDLLCRHQSHVAKILFNYFKIPYKLYIGFKKEEDNSIKGHAWTEVKGQQITGFCDPKEYVIQAVYS
ncbi:lasso peptide biosynthesis B2 protein [Aquirufa aurantiipilula]|uniref:Lasso peptide biosynthesis B2 protein n=1 Tax=Aquirufa aurantiipilula TaxID=2696561 RepID=A0ABT6BKW5_9BACT|nr:lasso peptide biosynthesis B2 protein [Aquirufa aurantiipilula]MDF5691009.1 lasso peptide biosynthesis B2 protein [Aquirufa aurantiipilula]